MVEVDEDVRRSEPLTETFASNDLAGRFDQDRQKLKRLLRQPNPCSVSGQLCSPEVELEEAEANRLLGRRNRHSTHSL